MRQIITVIVILIATCIFTIEADTQLDIFREGAVLLVQGVEESDKNMLADASDLLSVADADEILDFTVTESGNGALSDPYILFTGYFADNLRKNNFTLVPLNPLESLRYGGGVLSTVTRSMAPGACAVLSFEGNDEISAVCVASRKDSLKMSIITQDNEIPAEIDESKYARKVTFSPGENNKFSVKLENISSEPISFVIALQ